MSRLGLALAVLLFAVPALAGNVCGTVRDAVTQQTVAGAELVLFLEGTATAHHAVSGVDGGYCIVDVPAGTYDLRVRRDDYATQWITGIVVDDTATSVDVSWLDAARLDAPWPNPASGHVEFRFRLVESAPVRLRVFDARGRLVRGWDGFADADRATVVPWDLESVDGRDLPSGTYFVSLETGDQVLTRSFVRVR